MPHFDDFDDFDDEADWIGVSVSVVISVAIILSLACFAIAGRSFIKPERPAAMEAESDGR